MEADAAKLNEEGTRDRERQDKKDGTGEKIEEHDALSCMEGNHGLEPHAVLAAVQSRAERRARTPWPVASKAGSPLPSPLLGWRKAQDSASGAGPADEAGRVMLPDTPGLGGVEKITHFT